MIYDAEVDHHDHDHDHQPRLPYGHEMLQKGYDLTVNTAPDSFFSLFTFVSVPSHFGIYVYDLVLFTRGYT